MHRHDLLGKGVPAPLRATLQQGARETIWLTPGPLSKGPVGGASCSTCVPSGKDAGAWPPMPPCDPSARRTGKHLADTGPLEQGSGGCRSCSTSVPLGKDAGVGAPAYEAKDGPKK